MQIKTDPEALSSIADSIEETLADLLEIHYKQTGGKKEERLLYVTEMARFLNVSTSYIHKVLKLHSNLNPDLDGDEILFRVDKDSRDRKCMDQDNYLKLRTYLHEQDPNKGYLPTPRNLPQTESSAFVLAISHLKGGSGKTQTSMSFAQHAALMGYRVLVIDVDPQSSIAVSMGLVPDRDIPSEETLYPYVCGDEDSLEYAIRTTYWTNLDILPSNLDSYDIERILAFKQIDSSNNMEDYRYWEVLNNGIKTISHLYDIIIMDCSPSFSFMTTNALYAADGILVPSPPEILDYSSLGSLTRQLSIVFEAIAEYTGETKEWDFFNVAVNKFQNVKSANQLTAVMQDKFGARLLQNRMLLSEAVKTAGSRMKTPYELTPYEINRETYKRAFNSAYALNEEILELINSTREATQMELEHA